MRKLLVIPLLLALPATLAAQRMGFAHFSGHPGFNRAGFARSAYAVPFLDSLYSDYGYAAPTQPLVVVMQPQPQPQAAAPDPQRPPQPLMIELQGDRYVQVTGDDATPSQFIDRVPPSQPAHAPLAVTPKPQPVSTVLIFRDGHRQEISNYTIANATLYASSDYYNSGAWNQPIQLAQLNLPETMSANQQRGVQFRLPASPNEVIVGP